MEYRYIYTPCPTIQSYQLFLFIILSHARQCLHFIFIQFSVHEFKSCFSAPFSVDHRSAPSVGTSPSVKKLLVGLKFNLPPCLLSYSFLFSSVLSPLYCDSSPLDLLLSQKKKQRNITQELVFAFLEVDQQNYAYNSYCDYGSYNEWCWKRLHYAEIYCFRSSVVSN